MTGLLFSGLPVAAAPIDIRPGCVFGRNWKRNPMSVHLGNCNLTFCFLIHETPDSGHILVNGQHICNHPISL